MVGGELFVGGVYWDLYLTGEGQVGVSFEVAECRSGGEGCSDGESQGGWRRECG